MNNAEANKILHERSPADFIREIFLDRRKRNLGYSMNSFSRDLGISKSLLSRIFSGDRPVSLKLALQITSALELSEIDSKSLIFSVVKTSSKTAKISRKLREKLEADLQKHKEKDDAPVHTTIELERFRQMSSWYHMAILNMTKLDNFESDPTWIAKKLGIGLIEVQSALERLFALGLIEEKNGKIRRSSLGLYVRTNKSEMAVRMFHEQMIDKAKVELKKTAEADFQSRLINGITFTCGQEHVEMIKDRIIKFQDEIFAITSSGAKDSVYQMNVQFFGLTNRENL